MSEETNQEILAELRKLKRIFSAMLVVFILMSIPSFYYGFTHDSSNSWERVTTAMGRQNFTVALSMAQSLVRQQPDYSYGHAWLGAIYLAMDDVTNSEAQYSRACQLFPSEEYEKDLAAVRKRMAAAASFKLQSTLTLPNPAPGPTPTSH
jgi:cytochrome c-type biogenesis protein CcmH/NrfG